MASKITPRAVISSKSVHQFSYISLTKTKPPSQYTLYTLQGYLYLLCITLRTQKGTFNLTGLRPRCALRACSFSGLFHGRRPFGAVRGRRIHPIRPAAVELQFIAIYIFIHYLLYLAFLFVLFIYCYFYLLCYYHFIIFNLILLIIYYEF